MPILGTHGCILGTEGSCSQSRLAPGTLIRAREGMKQGQRLTHTQGSWDQVRFRDHSTTALRNLIVLICSLFFLSLDQMGNGFVNCRRRLTSWSPSHGGVLYKIHIHLGHRSFRASSIPTEGVCILWQDGSENRGVAHLLHLPCANFITLVGI